MSRIKSRGVDKKRPLRAYVCPNCPMTKRLRPGRHWHTCQGYEWELEDVAMSAGIAACVATAFHALAQSRNRP